MLSLMGCSLAAAASTDARSVLDTLRAGHPRLILLDEDRERVRAQIAGHPLAGEWYDAIRAEAAALQDAPPTEFVIIGPRLLGASRQVLDRVIKLGLVYRLDGDEAAGRRAVAELAAAAAWPHWNPSHFLDTAELNHAFGVGYDWLFPLLGEQREPIRRALVDKGLRPALEGYHRGAFWAGCAHNWNQVCNLGNAIGALALADEEPELAGEIVAKAVGLLPRAMREYAPDGGWAEGPMYWHYATRYTVYGLAALVSALGTDFGLSDIAGFEHSGDFQVHCVGPTLQTFNYADASAGVESCEEMFWLSRRFDRPLWAWRQRRLGTPHPYALIWFDPRGDGPESVAEPLNVAFGGIDVACLRGSWSDPDTTFVGIKGGDNHANHSHLDLGTFVLDALGERWFFEFGRDDYNLPGYFGDRRWSYYRLNTHGQNTLVIDGANQDLDAKAPLTLVESAADRGVVEIDLSAAYPTCRRVTRRCSLLDGRIVVFEDTIEADQPVDVAWCAHTQAQVDVDGPRAVLTQNGQRLTVIVESPAGARLEAQSARQAPPQADNAGITRLTAVLPEPLAEARLVLRIEPQRR